LKGVLSFCGQNWANGKKERNGAEKPRKIKKKACTISGASLFLLAHCAKYYHLQKDFNSDRFLA
jgi:hypothetical protein